MILTYAELFAGAGGMSLGLEAGGFHAAAHAEIEPNARAVLRHRWLDVRLDGDVSQINGKDYAGISLLSGGSPCQDLSVAGRRAGLTGSRSSLFHEQHRIWMESGAPYFLWENVHGAFSSNAGYDFATVLSTIVGRDLVADGAIRPDRTGKIKWLRAGRAVGPSSVVAWRVLDLQHFGPPQRRVRVFVLAARTGGVDPAEVLAFAEGVCGHPSPRQQSRESVATGTGRGVESCVALNISSSVPSLDDTMGTLDTDGASTTAIGAQTRGVVVAFGRSSFGGWDGKEVVSTVCSRDAKDMSSILVMANGQANASVNLNGCPTLTALNEAPIIVGALCAEDSVKWGTDQWARQNKVVVSQTYSAPAIDNIRADDVASTITKHTGGGGETQNPAFVVEPIFPTLAMGAHTAAPGGNGQDAPLSVVPHQNAPFIGRPRRLTPLEAERLMSWPDQWTATGRKDDGTAYALSDTARYRLCGNGVGSVCAEWIARRLHDAIQRQEEA